MYLDIYNEITLNCRFKYFKSRSVLPILLTDKVINSLLDCALTKFTLNWYHRTSRRNKENGKKNIKKTHSIVQKERSDGCIIDGCPHKWYLLCP